MTVRIATAASSEVAAAHLRAAALLRGVPARPRVHRGARHHRAHLRHLPGRLPDERRAARWRTPAASRSTADPRAAPAPLLRRVDREPRAARLHAPRARLPRLRRAPSSWPRDHREVVERGARAEEGRQRDDDASSAAARCTRSTCASAASTARRASASCAPLVEQLERAREIALETVRWTAGLRLPRLRAATTSSSRSPSPASTRSSAGASSRPRASTSTSREYDEHFVEEHVAALERAALAAARARRLPLRPAGALRARLRPALAARARGGARGRPRRRPCRNPFRSIVVRARRARLRRATRRCG